MSRADFELIVCGPGESKNPVDVLFDVGTKEKEFGMYRIYCGSVEQYQC